MKRCVLKAKSSKAQQPTWVAYGQNVATTVYVYDSENEGIIKLHRVDEVYLRLGIFQ